jgi:hypothetical protein
MSLSFVLIEMKFKDVIQTCFDFSIANGGTIATFSCNCPDKLEVHSRATPRIELRIELDCERGVWTVGYAGEKTPVARTFLTHDELLQHLARLWEKQLCSVEELRT